jgi:hypothetical protein
LASSGMVWQPFVVASDGLEASTPAASIAASASGTWMMPFSPKIIGSPILPAIHGGMTGAFLETVAIIGVTRELSAAEGPRSG